MFHLEDVAQKNSPRILRKRIGSRKELNHELKLEHLEGEVHTSESFGNVFISHQQELLMMCSSCDTEYTGLDLFEKHLRQQHHIFERPLINPETTTETTKSIEDTKSTEIIESAVASKPTETTNTNKIIMKETTKSLEILDKTVREKSPNAVKPRKSTAKHKATRKNKKKLQEDVCAGPENETEPKNIVKQKITRLEKLEMSNVQAEKTQTSPPLPPVKKGRRTVKAKVSVEGDKTSNSLMIKSQPSEINSPVDKEPLLIQSVKRFICDECPRSFKENARLVEHKRLHTGEKPFKCDICDKQFRVSMRLNEHKRRHSKEKKFKCDICELGCCTKQELNLHMRHHANDRRFKCSSCPKAFVRSSDLKIHMRVHTGEKPFVCDICHKCFQTNQNLCVHKKSHMGDASKTYKCEHCDKKFMRNIDLKVHMRSHTGEKRYKCDICDRGYSSKFNVRAHMERDHISGNGRKKTGPKPKALREELDKQKKLIAELQQQLLQQI